MALRIVADRNIAFVEQAFAALGKVEVLPSEQLTADALRDADVVLVRSTVKVNEALLGASRARFVATATIGTDHVDTAWLTARGIGWASAPGSNADSVAQWWTAAMLTIAERRAFPLVRLTVGIVGVGAIGSRVEKIAHALGCAVLRCDPPRARAEGDDGFVGLRDLLAASDVITFHVPLASDGPDRTVHLLDAANLAQVSPRAVVINASRGPVVDTRALAELRREGRLRGLVLDVFEDEPAPSPDVIEAADLATPHIAGHSLDGKANGTLAIYRAACAHFGVPAKWRPDRALPPPPVRTLAVDTRALTDEATALLVLRRFYRVEDDDGALRRMMRLAPAERGVAFQKYRANYPVRRELHGAHIQLVPPRPRAAALLTVLGAQLSIPDVD